MKRVTSWPKAIFVLGCVASFGWMGTPAMANRADVQRMDEDTTIMVVAEVAPQFEGNMNQWMGENIRYPEEAHSNQIEGRVFVSFVIEKDGSVSHVTVVRSAHPILDAEAVRVIQSMPKWKPAMSEGKTVRFSQTVPITFKLSTPEEPFTFEKYLENLKMEDENIKKGESLTPEQQAERVAAFKSQLGDDATLYKMLLEKSKSIQAGVDSTVKAQAKVLQLKKAEAKELAKIYQTEMDSKIGLIEGLGEDQFIAKFVAAELKMQRIEMDKVLQIQALLKDRFKLYFENVVLQK